MFIRLHEVPEFLSGAVHKILIILALGVWRLCHVKHLKFNDHLKTVWNSDLPLNGSD